MTRSIADQTESQLGGSRSVLVRQKRDHIELDRLLYAIDGSAGADREDLINSLCKLVFPHAFAEESVLWPLVRAELPDGEELTLQIEREHQEINELFTELEQIGPDTPEHRELFDRIAAVLREDVRDEEDVLLPKLQDRVSPKQLRQIGMQWEVVRRTAPTRPHPVVARRPPGNVLAALPLTILDRGRDQLDGASRRTHGSTAARLRTVSGALAAAAGRIEHLPLLTRGDRAETHRE
ncbi:hemerythrin domain-containing protein [Williamsia sp. DF01-3]|uniref:hemerythrin domain-containing protein n=1 Tax=Williamsia sp. DF01-3 TaxID=2934157 RepID=UPI001FF48E2D|nr:hemerythrin domain-containing protein [Williamsia sp. DF01-3]MCK0516645.1 hemerythrin domain-containing protein [Williamsia sp. DF01-3]